MSVLRSLRAALSGDEARPPAGDCGCEATVDGTSLVVDADACRAGGKLAEGKACRAVTVDALAERDVGRIAVRSDGRERRYGEEAAALFGAAGRFAVALRGIDERLAARTRRDPLGAAREAAGRAGQVAELAADAGLTRHADGASYDAFLEPAVGPVVSHWRVRRGAPAEGTLEVTTTLETGARVRIYDGDARETRVYHLEPAEARFDDATSRLLRDAHRHLARTPLGGDAGAIDRAVGAVAGEAASRAAVTRALRKHTHEPGLLRDFFADPDLSDVYVTAPAPENAVRVRVDGETLDTNVRLTDEGVQALASRFRRESGRGFSRATPTLDAATEVGGRRVRVAGVTEPVSDGFAFAFRAHDRDVWTLPALVDNGTLSAAAAGVLSVAVERGAATLLAGPRGSGKTTTLGALLWEIPAPVRTIVIEDAPELPVAQLQASGRDVQALRTDDRDGPTSPTAALRTALRLGDGALVVGEVRGEEASVLYEAMRVGANSEAVLGTIHGDGAQSVFERVVSDLGVPASSFGATDLLVTLETARTGRQLERRVRSIEEVVPADSVEFATLFERTGEGLLATGRVERGDSRLVSRLTRPEETYADTLDRIEGRTDRVEERATGVRPSRARPARADATDGP